MDWQIVNWAKWATSSRHGKSIIQIGQNQSAWNISTVGIKRVSALAIRHLPVPASVATSPR
jgi:hypothetical protein